MRGETSNALENRIEIPFQRRLTWDEVLVALAHLSITTLTEVNYTRSVLELGTIRPSPDKKAEPGYLSNNTDISGSIYPFG